MHIDLFSAQPGSPTHHSPSKEKRPPQISVSKVFSSNHKWKECKIIGKNISIRSYSAACAYRSRLYLYGGYQILNGSLHDFYSISLDESEPTFLWEQIISKGDNPGSRSKHALLGGASKIYLIGGLKANNQATGEIHQFDPSTKLWKLLKPEGVKLPPIQSFSAVLVNRQDEQRIIIAFGFNEDKAAPSNTIYEYNIPKNKISILHEGSEVAKAGVPSARIGSAITSDNQSIYIFGGKDENKRLNDLWSFSLKDFKFQRITDSGQIPAIRNGHTMSYNDGKLYVFGGIHDVTWELDDLHIFSLAVKNSRWTTLQQDSPRKIDKKQIVAPQPQQQKNEQKQPRKKNWLQTHSAGLNKQNPNSPSKNFSITYNEDANRNQSPGKMLDEQRRKVFYQKKAEMLSNFQISNQQKEKYIALQTSSQAMKISLDVIGNPDPKIKSVEDRLTDFGKQSVSKFLQPLENNSNIVIGKKPCARDGHCTVIIGEDLVIFGGDRHQMSFNDIYKLNIKMAVKELAH